MDITDKLSDEQIEYLEKKYGHFWMDAREVYELAGEEPPNASVTVHYSKEEIERDIAFILNQLSNNHIFHIHMLKRLENLLSLLHIPKKDVIQTAKEKHLEPPIFFCNAYWEEEIFHIEMNHQLAKMKKVVQIKEYQTLRDYYVPRMMEAFVKEKPNVPLERSLLFIEHYVGDYRLFDIDNRFRSFVMDALERSKVIKNDSGDHVMILEKMHRNKGEEGTYIRVVPQHKIGQFICKNII